MSEAETSLLIIDCLKKVRDPERIKQIVFDHVFISKIDYELKIAKKSKPELDEASFVMGIVAGAKIVMEMEVMNIKP